MMRRKKLNSDTSAHLYPYVYTGTLRIGVAMEPVIDSILEKILRLQQQLHPKKFKTTPWLCLKPDIVIEDFQPRRAQGM